MIKVLPKSPPFVLASSTFYGFFLLCFQSGDKKPTHYFFLYICETSPLIQKAKFFIHKQLKKVINCFSFLKINFSK